MKKRRVLKFIVWMVGAALLLCVAAALISAWSNRGLPEHSAVVERLSALEKGRLAEVIQLRRTLGGKVWPGWDTLDIPILLYNEEYAFLVGLPDPAPGWINVSTGVAQGAGWEIVPDDTFDGQPYYRQPIAGLAETPQAFTVRVADRWVASMTTKEWTEIKLRGYIQADLPPLIAKIFPYSVFLSAFNSDWYMCAVLHESMHAYQGTVARERLEQAEKSMEAAKSYPWENDALQEDWQTELDLLVRALRAESDQEARELAASFLNQREARRTRHALSPALVDFERQREWEEGLAKYIELEIWRQASKTEDYAPLAALAEDPDFKNYTTFDQRWQQEVSQLARMARGEEDERFYYTGMAQAVLLDRLAPGWKETVMVEGVFLEDLLKSAVSGL